MNRQDKILIISAASLFVLALIGGAGLFLADGDALPELPAAGDPVSEPRESSGETTHTYAQGDPDSGAEITPDNQPSTDGEPETQPAPTPPSNADAQPVAPPATSDRDTQDSNPGLQETIVFAYVKAIRFESGGAVVTLDAAEFLIEEEAEAAAAQAGVQLPSAGYLIVNDSTAVKSYVMDSSVRVRLTTAEDNTIGTPRHVTSPDWAAMYVAGDPAQLKVAPYWFRISGEKILSVQEQFLP